MIDYASLQNSPVPQPALIAYQKYEGDQQAASKAEDYDALAHMQAWGAFIEAQQLAPHSGEMDEEEEEGDGACPLCGEDGGTGCGMPGCEY